MSQTLKKILIPFVLVFLLLGCFILNSCHVEASAARGSYDDKGNCSIPKGDECTIVTVEVHNSNND